MSRKGKLQIDIPSGVQVKVQESEITVKGPKGILQKKIPEAIDVMLEEKALTVVLKEEGKGNLHGLYRSLIQNMVTGVHTGFERKLEMIGVGYRAAVAGGLLDLQLGFSHPTKLKIPEGIQVSIEKGTMITLKGLDRQEIGQFAATVRKMRPPEPYQGKGIRYSGEYVRKKAGKSAAKK